MRTFCCTLLALLIVSPLAAQADDLNLHLRYQEETSPESGRYHRLTRAEQWSPGQTAIIVCDMWDLHHCRRAVLREEEFAPTLNGVLKEARRRGAIVIHAPSGCMDHYSQHPARKRAVETPRATELPEDIQSWCSKIPSEERGIYPIDQSDGGEDDDPEEHAQWEAKLRELGRNPKAPWQKQTDLVEIDAESDYISDRGEEVWSILEHHGISNVVLTGVHTNMCVLGRPFGLRQMARNGKSVVLMRDLTDTMYNPASWPYVSHFTGTDLIVSHIEKFVCPTITSDQILGGKPFRFANDGRPNVAIVMAEDEYETEQTLPPLAVEHLGKHFRTSLVFGSEGERHNIPGIEVLDEADVLLVSVRRRVLPADQMAVVRRFVAEGKPLVGIRTASHAFSIRESVPEGYDDWPEFDAEVFGGNYHGHHGNRLASQVEVHDQAGEHPILRGLTREAFAQGGSLYRTSPLAKGTQPLLIGSVAGHPPEPAAWTFQRADGGRSFYTSLGHRDDFENPEFVRLLVGGIHWAAGLPVQAGLDRVDGRR